MKIFLIVLLVVFVILISLIALLLFSYFSVIMSTEGKTISLKLKTLGITFNIPLNKENKKEFKKEKKKEEKPEENQESVMKKFLDLKNNFNRQKKALELTLIYLRKRIEISEFGVIGEFGLGNAATTGMVYGMVSGFINMVFGFLGQYFTIKKPPNEAVNLNYDKAVFNLKFAFMIKTKLWFLLKAFFIYRNNMKEM